MANRLSQLTDELFLDGPGEFLARSVATLIAAEPHFKVIFGTAVDGYDRQDYPMRDLPALRIYVLNYSKESESHYITGDVHADVIFPAAIRRLETEQLTSRVAAALLQQFRRPTFFAEVTKLVPGLNELGKVFSVDKNLVFQNTEQVDECPVVKIVLNFRLDLKVWDEYLEIEGRTKDNPFDVTLGDLKKVSAIIQAIKVDSDLSTVDIKLQSQQIIGG